MPTYARIGPYLLVFWSIDRTEPVHIHVRRERMQAKFWLANGVELATNRGFPDHELRAIERIVTAHRERIIQFWNGYFAG